LTHEPVLSDLLYNLEERSMATKTSYSHARENLASLWDEVEDSREAAVIQRRGHEDMALIPAAELSRLQETAYLLRAPENAVRLLAALTRARGGKKKPTDLKALRKSLERAP
jgi:antitoxin YefM